MRAFCHCCVFLSLQGFLHESTTSPAFSFSREPAEKQVIVVREGELSWEVTGLPIQPPSRLTISKVLHDLVKM